MHSRISGLQASSLANNEPDIVRSVERTNWEGNSIHNLLLLSLPDAEFQSLRSLLTYQVLPNRSTLHESGTDLEFAHFLNRGLVSIVVTTRNGKTVEVAAVGNEGFIGTTAVVGLKRSPNRAVVQVAGDGFWVRTEGLRDALSKNPRMLASFCRYAAIQGMQVAQCAACNRLHGVEQRLARWLLTMQDRTNQISLQITHDSLATVLGTDRPSVSLAAGHLQRNGAIEYRRGIVAVVDHKSLEDATCECYSVIQQLNTLLSAH